MRCDAEYGRVVVISLKRHSYRSSYYPAEPFAHNIAALATLTELRHLNLELLNDGAYGDIAWLSGLTELRLQLGVPQCCALGDLALCCFGLALRRAVALGSEDAHSI